MLKQILCLGLGFSLLGLTACGSAGKTSSQTSSIGSILSDVPNDDSLFPDGPDGIYNYAPVVKQHDEKTRYVFYCSNVIPYNITDHIACRKGTLQADGSWKWGEKQIVLAPTPDTFDSRHTCDPAVVAGEFKYQGTTYNYLMTYTAAVTENNQDNDTGIAVAKDPMGPWIKPDNLNPFFDWKRSTDEESKNLFQWGYGQPSMINIDKKGKILIFYTVGTHVSTGTYVERWDLSDLDNPIKEASNQVTNRGLTNLNGGADYINGADFGYDAKSNRFYAVSDCHPCPSSTPDFISDRYRLTYISDTPVDTEGHQIGDVFFQSGGKSWSTMETIGPDQTGFPRNHNTGLVTDDYGWFLEGDTIETLYAMSQTTNNFTWTYRIYEYPVKKTE